MARAPSPPGGGPLTMLLGSGQRSARPSLDAVGIRVVLAEDNTLLREGIARLLERADDIDLVGTAADRPSWRR